MQAYFIILMQTCDQSLFNNILPTCSQMPAYGPQACQECTMAVGTTTCHNPKCPKKGDCVEKPTKDVYHRLLLGISS